MMAVDVESNDGDPRHFLNTMEPHLGNGGCIKSVDEVAAIVEAMKNARLMVNKCLLLNIIKATKADSTLESLMGLGGWTILNMWLSDSKKAQNVALLIQLMEVLMQLPVTLECLKQGNMGKLVKQLTKQENQDVKTLASELLTKWMAIFKQSKSKKEDEHGDRASKRPRDLPNPVLTSSFHAPPDKKAKNSPTKMKSTSLAAGMTESSGFMNAISSQVAAVAKLKKPKRPPLKHSQPGLQATSAAATTTTSVSSSTVSTTSNSTVNNSVDNKAMAEGTTANSSQETDKLKPAGLEKKAKKRVSFASDDALTEIFYFEMDESERSAMRSRNFMDAAQAEKMREREAMENVKLLYHDNMIEMTPWVRPSSIDGVISLVNSGCMSEQKRIQMEREQKVLAELFLDKKSLPFSPAEPDPETAKDETEPKLIPLWEPGMEPPQELPMLPPGAPLPGVDMNTPYNQHLQQISPGMEPNPSLLPQPQLPVDRNQPYFHGPDGQEWRPHSQGGFRGPPLPPPGSHNWGTPRGPPDRGGRGSRQVCKHYTSHGCRLGAACRFFHPPEYNRNIRTNT